MSARLLKALFDIDAALVKGGVPPLSPYWRAESEHFYLHPTAKLLVEEVGRGGGKDITTLKQALTETLVGDFKIPVGERHYFVHVSENLAEATKARRQLEQYLTILNIVFTTNGDAIELRDMPRGFRVLAARIGAVSGYRAFGWTLNEAAKLNFEGVNPSGELVASMRGMTVTHSAARGRVVSSPMGKRGFFFELCSRGNTEHQVFGHAASHEANPAITLEHTMSLEPDVSTHAREYLALASDDVSAALDSVAIRRCLRDPGPVYALSQWVGVADWSQGLSEKGDATTAAVACWVMPMVSDQDAFIWDDAVDARGIVLAPKVIARRDAKGNQVPNPDFQQPKPQLLVLDIQARSGAFGAVLQSDELVAEHAALFHRYGVTRCFADNYQGYALQSLYAKHRIAYCVQTWSNESKQLALGRMRTWAKDSSLAIYPSAEGERTVMELCNLTQVIRPSGALSVGARRGGHDDRAALIINLAMADGEGALAGSPIRKTSACFDISNSFSSSL